MGDGAGSERVHVELGGVAETLLWTLYFRASEAARPDGVLRDPMGVDLLDRTDVDFRQRFGPPGSLMCQVQGLRAGVFDHQVRRFLADHPDGTVVALGEGLETQFWRVDNGRVRWLTVELPEVTALRAALLPSSPRLSTVDGSVTDGRWMDQVDPGRGVLVVAQGLFMYLQPDEVLRLVADCAERFGGGALVFDAVPRWFAAATRSGRMRTPGGFRSPPMPYALDVDEQSRLRRAHPNVTGVRDLLPAAGRGVLGRLLPHVDLVPVLRHKRPSVLLVTFGRRP